MNRSARFQITNPGPSPVQTGENFLFGITIQQLDPSKHINSHLQLHVCACKAPLQMLKAQGVTKVCSEAWTQVKARGSPARLVAPMSSHGTYSQILKPKKTFAPNKQTVSPLGTQPINDNMARRDGKGCVLDRGDRP